MVTPLPRPIVATVLIVFFLVVLLPIFFMVLSSLWAQGLTLDSYGSLLDVRYLKIGLNSILLAAGATFFALLIGIPQAYLLERTAFWGKSFLKMTYLVPILIPPYIHAIVWQHLLGQTGAVNQFLVEWFHLEGPAFTIYGLGGTIFVLTLAYFPFVTALVSSGLKTLDYRLEEAASLCNPPRRVLLRVTLPMLSSHILCGAMFIFVFSMVNFGVPDFLRVPVYPTEVFVQFSAFYDTRAATALSVPLILFTLVLVLVVKKAMGGRPYVALTSRFRPAPLRALKGGSSFLGVTFLATLFTVATVVPIVMLTAGSKSWENYVKVLTGSFDQILYTLFLSVCGALLMVILSFFLGYLIQRSRFATILDFGTLIPFAVPATVLGVGIIQVWNHPVTQWVYGSSVIILIAYVAHFIPFTVRIVLSDLQRIDVRMEESASLTATGWFRIMGRIVVPLSSRGLMVAFFIALVLCFGDLSTTLMTIPPGRETVPIKIYNLMHYGAEHMVSALCLTVVLILLAVGGLFFLLYKKATKR